MATESILGVPEVQPPLLDHVPLATRHRAGRPRAHRSSGEGPGRTAASRSRAASRQAGRGRIIPSHRSPMDFLLDDEDDEDEDDEVLDDEDFDEEKDSDDDEEDPDEDDEEEEGWQVRSALTS